MERSAAISQALSAINAQLTPALTSAMATANHPAALSSFRKLWQSLSNTTQSIATFLKESRSSFPPPHLLADLSSSLKSFVSDISSSLSEYTPYVAFRSTVKRFFATFLRILGWMLRKLNWLLAPGIWSRLFYRHLIALLVLWSALLIWRMFLLSPLMSAVQQLHIFWWSRLFKEQFHILHRRMDEAATYGEWRAAATDLDRLEGKYRWKENSRSNFYDWRRIKHDLARFRKLVDAGDAEGIMLYARARLVRNLVGINDKGLHQYLRAGTKRLIEEYISEVVRALQLVCVVQAPGISSEDKLAFFNETRHAYGRSALLLSGGATLGLYHTGVVKVLHENNLLPRVLSGSSVGSIVVGMIGTRTDDEVAHLLDPENAEIQLNFFPPTGGSIRRKLSRFVHQGVLMDIGILAECVKANVNRLTFQEAYDRTGRIINIVVSPAAGHGNQDSLRLLNYLTAPNVLVWSACLASCAIPGVYAPVELLAKNEYGEEVPYLEGQVKWEDGSVRADLPMDRLSELFNVNHFIVSQVNPHVVPFLTPTTSDALATSDWFLSTPLSRFIEFLSSELKNSLLNLSRLGLLFGAPVHHLLDQKYVGDITIVPDVRFADYTLLLVNPTAERLLQCLRNSQKSTFTMLSRIRIACEVEFTLDECVRRMRAALILEEFNAAHKNSSMSRVRSWSTEMLANEKKLEKKELAEEELGYDTKESPKANTNTVSKIGDTHSSESLQTVLNGFPPPLLPLPETPATPSAATLASTTTLKMPSPHKSVSPPATAADSSAAVADNVPRLLSPSPPISMPPLQPFMLRKSAQAVSGRLSDLRAHDHDQGKMPSSRAKSDGHLAGTELSPVASFQDNQTDLKSPPQNADNLPHLPLKRFSTTSDVSESTRSPARTLQRRRSTTPPPAENGTAANSGMMPILKPEDAMRIVSESPRLRELLKAPGSSANLHAIDSALSASSSSPRSGQGMIVQGRTPSASSRHNSPAVNGRSPPNPLEFRLGGSPSTSSLTAAGAAADIQNALPSLTTFRRTSPRRMSNRTLRKLDKEEGNEDESSDSEGDDNDPGEDSHAHWLVAHQSPAKKLPTFADAPALTLQRLSSNPVVQSSLTPMRRMTMQRGASFAALSQIQNFGITQSTPAHTRPLHLRNRSNNQNAADGAIGVSATNSPANSVPPPSSSSSSAPSSAPQFLSSRDMDSLSSSAQIWNDKRPMSRAFSTLQFGLNPMTGGATNNSNGYGRVGGAGSAAGSVADVHQTVRGRLRRDNASGQASSSHPNLKGAPSTSSLKNSAVDDDEAKAISDISRLPHTLRGMELTSDLTSLP